jgi:hypothetical protein
MTSLKFRSSGSSSFRYPYLLESNLPCSCSGKHDGIAVIPRSAKKICGLLLTDLRKPPLHALDLAYIDVSLAINFCPAVLVFPVTCKQYGLSSFAYYRRQHYQIVIFGQEGGGLGPVA